jgi:hypothetical protein
MVDFSNRAEVGRWLEEQPREVAVAVVARAALRVLPLIVNMRPDATTSRSGIPLLCFRAAAMAWVTAKYPAHSNKLREAAAAAGTPAAAHVPGIVSRTTDYSTISAAKAYSAASLAALFVAGNAARGPRPDAATVINTASDAAGASAAAMRTAFVLMAETAALATNAAEADAALIEAGGSRDNGVALAAELAARPLWPGETPFLVSEPWAQLEARLLAVDEDWEVWIEWYKDRLAGRPSDQELELARALLPDDLWQQGPKAINSEIRRLIREASNSGSAGLEQAVSSRPPQSSPPEPIPPQGAGPRFRISEAGQIAIAPPASELDAAGNDIGRVRQLLPLVRGAADDLAAALNPNQFPVLYRNLSDYRAAVAADARTIAWGVVFGLGVRLANAADAAQRQIEDRLLSALEDQAQEALQSLNMLHSSLIVATAEGRELEEQTEQLQMTREQQAALRADAVAIAAKLHGAAEVIEPQADKIVAEAAELIGEGRHPERGSAFGIATFKHVTIVLVSAGTAAAIGAAVGGEMGAAFGGAVGTAVGTASTWLGLEVLKTSANFKAATAALGEGYDRLLEIDGTKLQRRLIQLVPLRRFVSDNQEPLRRIATNTRQMRWMLPYIDFIVLQNETKGVAPTFRDPMAEDSSRVEFGKQTQQLELSFDADDPACNAQVQVEAFDRAGVGAPSWSATSIRIRVRVNGRVMRHRVAAYITRIEKLTAAGEWQDGNFPQIQTTWTDTGDILTDISGNSAKYANVLHINHPDNKLTVYQRPTISTALADFAKDATTYRFTVSAAAEGLAANARMEIDWKGKWDTIQVRPA